MDKCIYYKKGKCRSLIRSRSQVRQLAVMRCDGIVPHPKCPYGEVQVWAV